MMKFKRTHCMFDGGEVRIGHREKFLPQQRVRIIRPMIAGDDDEEDLYEVEFTNEGRATVEGWTLNPPPASPATNEELLVHMCNYGQTAMVQAFIMTAIQNAAQEVVDNADEVRASMAGSMIHPDAWIGAAKEVLEAMKGRD